MDKLALFIFIISSFHVRHSTSNNNNNQYGIFTLNFMGFTNPTGRLANGQCCTGEPDMNGCPRQPCTTAFIISIRPPMGSAKWETFDYGRVKTPIMGDDRNLTFNFTTNFNITDFSWQVNFQLLIAAFHVKSENETFELEDKDKLISSNLVEGRLTPKDGFSEVMTSEGDYEKTVEWRGKLKCVNNYHGDQCQRSCKSRDDLFGHFTCDYEGNKVCLIGWKNPKSQRPCTQLACPVGCVEDNAICDSPGVCRCRNGWKGSNCDVCVRKSGCLKGTCAQPDQCNCQTGWTGPICNIDKNFCSHNSPCRNGGKCLTGISLNRNYTCTCQPGYEGDNCGKYNPCYHQPCENNATCLLIESGYECSCTEKYEGKHCEKPKCTCENGGKCLENSDVCECPDKYMGEQCEIKNTATTTTTTEETTTKQEETTTKPKIICAPDPNNKTDMKCKCQGSHPCPERVQSGRCFSDDDCGSGHCHPVNHQCMCPRTHSGHFCQVPVTTEQATSHHGQALSTGQVVILSVVVVILLVAFTVTACVVRQRQSQDDVIETSKEENSALAPSADDGVNFKSPTSSIAATSNA